MVTATGRVGKGCVNLCVAGGAINHILRFGQKIGQRYCQKRRKPQAERNPDRYLRKEVSMNKFINHSEFMHYLMDDELQRYSHKSASDEGGL